jgi:HSP20 family protein
MSQGSFFSKLSFRSNPTPDYFEPEFEPVPVVYPDENPGEAQLSVDMLVRENDIVIQTIIAGVRLQDIDITISRTTITIRGFRENPFEASYDSVQYTNQELFWGPFSRELELPDEVDIDSTSATEDHGLLTIKMPKVNKERMNKIKVKDK